MSVHAPVKLSLTHRVVVIAIKHTNKNLTLQEDL